MKRTIIAAAFSALLSLPASAATQLFEVDLIGINGDAALLADLGISANSDATVQFSIDFALGPATTVLGASQDIRKYNYDFVNLLIGGETISLVDADGSTNRLHIRDGKASSTADQLQIFSAGTAGSGYSDFGLIAYESDETAYSHGDSVTDALLNGFQGRHFYMGREINGVRYQISTSNLFFREVDQIASTSLQPDTEQPSPVPLPASFPLILAGLGGLFLLRRRSK